MLIIFVGISSLIKMRIPPPWQFLSYLNGGLYPSTLSCICGKEESNFASKTIRMSMLFFTILDNSSNLFLMELIFICLITTLFASFIRIFFKISNGLSSHLLSIVLKVFVGFTDFKSNHTLDSQRHFTISLL